MNLINGSGGRSVRKLARSILPQNMPLVNTFLKKFNLEISYLAISLVFSVFLFYIRLLFLFFHPFPSDVMTEKLPLASEPTVIPVRRGVFLLLAFCAV